MALITWRFGSVFTPQKQLTQGVVGLYNHTNLPLFIVNLLSQSLVILDKEGKSQPNLVSGWQVNNDATVYTFKLKDNLFWNNGEGVISSDLKFDLPDINISYPDEGTIVFKLKDSFSPFPTFLTTPVVKGDKILGINGPFKVSKKEEKGDYITKLILTPKDQALPTVQIKFYPDEKIAKTAFQLGEVDSLINIANIQDLGSYPSLRVKKKTNFNKLVAVFYNTNDKYLGDKNLRKALSYASPIFMDEERAKTPIPPFSWAYNHQIKEVIYDQELAKSYLNKSQVDKNISITLTTTPALSLVGEKVIEAWRRVGIDGVLQVESGIPQNFQALLTSQTIPQDPDQYLLWHSTQTKTNLSKYTFNKRIDKDLEDGRKLADQEKRKEKYLDFQKVLLDDSPATFLYFPKTEVVYRQKAEELLNQILPLQM